MTNLTKIPTTNAEAKAYFNGILKGNTFKDWREFLGTLSGVNTKKLSALELYDLKIKMDEALRNRSKPDEATRLITAIKELETKVDKLVETAHDNGTEVIPSPELVAVTDALNACASAGRLSLKEVKPGKLGLPKRILIGAAGAASIGIGTFATIALVYGYFFGFMEIPADYKFEDMAVGTLLPIYILILISGVLNIANISGGNNND